MFLIVQKKKKKRHECGKLCMHYLFDKSSIEAIVGCVRTTLREMVITILVKKIGLSILYHNCV